MFHFIHFKNNFLCFIIYKEKIYSSVFRWSVYLEKPLSCSKYVMFSSRWRERKSPIYSRGPFLGMGLDALGKAQGTRRVQDSFPCIPSQLPSVVISVMMNTASWCLELANETILCPTSPAQAAVCDDSHEHTGLEAGMFPHLTGIRITYPYLRTVGQIRDDAHFS